MLDTLGIERWPGIKANKLPPQLDAAAEADYQKALKSVTNSSQPGVH